MQDSKVVVILPDQPADRIYDKHFENGTYRFSKAPFGYHLVNGTFEVNAEQARIVKEIFAGVLSGKGTTMIAKELNARNIPTGTKRRDGSPGVWNSSMILGIVKNVVYTGDLLMQKTYRENNQVKKNYNEVPQFFMKDHHEQIIDRESFEKANYSLKQRGIEKNNLSSDNKKLRNSIHQNRYPFSGRLLCGCCGGKMRRVIKKSSKGPHFYWVCVEHVKNISHCSMIRQKEESLRNAFVTMMNKLVYTEPILQREEIMWKIQPANNEPPALDPLSGRGEAAVIDAVQVWKEEKYSEKLIDLLIPQIVDHAVVQTNKYVIFSLVNGMKCKEDIQ